MKKVLKDGKWEEGEASPELLREDLRRLPKELVTKDPGDPTKIHEADAPHTQDSIIGEYEEEVTGAAQSKRLKEAFSFAGYRKENYTDLSRPIPITEDNLAFERLAATVSLIQGAQALVDKYGGSLGEELDEELREILGVHHLWFPDDNILNAELRHGNPPSESGRPKHLKRKNLVIHPWEPDQHVKDLLGSMMRIDFDLLKRIFEPGLFNDKAN